MAGGSLGLILISGWRPSARWQVALLLRVSFWQVTGAFWWLLADDRCLLVASGFLIKVFSFQFRDGVAAVAGGRWLLADTVTVAPSGRKHFKVPVKMKYEFVNFLKVVLFSEQNIFEICHGCVAKSMDWSYIFNYYGLNL